jgi:hypothetical protein
MTQFVSGLFSRFIPRRLLRDILQFLIILPLYPFMNVLICHISTMFYTSTTHAASRDFHRRIIASKCRAQNGNTMHNLVRDILRPLLILRLYTPLSFPRDDIHVVLYTSRPHTASWYYICNVSSTQRCNALDDLVRDPIYTPHKHFSLGVYSIASNPTLFQDTYCLRKVLT